MLGFTARLKRSTTWRAITPSLPSIPTGFASRFALGLTRPASSGMPQNGHHKSRSCVAGLPTTRSKRGGLGIAAPFAERPSAAVLVPDQNRTEQRLRRCSRRQVDRAAPLRHDKAAPDPGPPCRFRAPPLAGVGVAPVGRLLPIAVSNGCREVPRLPATSLRVSLERRPHPYVVAPREERQGL